MYSADTYSKFLKDQYPDIIREEITNDILDIIIRQADTDNKLGIEKFNSLIRNADFIKSFESKKIDLNKMDLLDNPSADSVHYSVEKLFCLGAITPNMTPTITGLIFNKFRLLSIESIRMILAGYIWGTSILDLITIAAFQDTKTKDLMTPPAMEIQKNTELMRADDFIQCLVIWDDFVAATGKGSVTSIREWCSSHKISTQTMIDVSDTRDDIIRTLTSIGLCVLQKYEDSLKFGNTIEKICSIKKCIFEGYKLNMASLDANELGYTCLHSHVRFNIPKRSWMIRTKYIIYDKITIKQSNKTQKFEAVPNMISALDGYVPLDTNFDTIKL
jgi:HrpA-like RNA helicase